MTTPPTSASAPARPLSPALDTTFKIGLVLKGLDGILEVAGGILLLFLSPHAIQHLVRVLTAHELAQDPHDLIARYLLHTTAHLNTGITIFGAIYLLSHGIAKIVLVALVLRDKLWAYPWLIVLLLAFIAYQLYRITAVHFSIGLTLLTIFDAFLAWLTWREYRAKRDRRQRAMAPATARASQDHPGGRGGGQERAAEVADGADASGAGEQPAAQQQAGQAHGLPDQAGSADHPAANAIRDMRLDDGGEGGVAGGGAGSVAHQRGQRRGQRGDAGERGVGQPRGPNAVKTTMGRQVRVGSRVSRIGQVRAPAAMAASSPYPPPQVCSLPAARTTSRALAAPASDEVERLRAVLRRQAIEPGDGTA